MFCFLHQVLDDFYRIFCSSICLLVVWRWFRVNDSHFSCEIWKFLWTELRTVVRNYLIWNSISRNIFFQKLNGIFRSCTSKLFNFNVPREIVNCYNEMLSIVHHKIYTYFLPWPWRFYANHGFCSLMVLICIACIAFWHKLFDFCSHVWPKYSLSCSLDGPVDSCVSFVKLFHSSSSECIWNYYSILPQNDSITNCYFFSVIEIISYFYWYFGFVIWPSLFSLLGQNL